MKTDYVFTEADNHDLGFCRFYYPGEEELKDGFWDRSVIVSKDGITDETSIIRIPENSLIELSKEPAKKLIYDEKFGIACAGGEIRPMHRLSRRAGWNQTENDLRELITLDPAGNFIAAYQYNGNTIPLGTGAVLPAGGNTSWIGMILVHPELRRQGIAQAVMDRCILHAVLVRGYRVNGLDATPMGLAVYRSLGYRETCHLWLCALDTGTGEFVVPEARIRRMDSAHNAVRYEEKKMMSRRDTILESMFRIYGEGSYLYLSGNEIAGYVMSRPRRLLPSIGPLRADSPEIARALLGAAVRHWAERGHSAVSLATFEAHFSGTAPSVEGSGNDSVTAPEGHILSPNIRPQRMLSRMYLMVEKNDTEKLLQSRISGGLPPGDADSLKRVLEKASLNFGETDEHVHREIHELIPFNFAICGPELG